MNKPRKRKNPKYTKNIYKSTRKQNNRKMSKAIQRSLNEWPINICNDSQAQW